VIETKLEHVRVDLVDEPEEPSRLDIDEAGIHELAASISAQGLLEPIGVQPYGPSERYRLSYGHRRLLAVRFLGWFTIPAIILPETCNLIEAQQHENNQRVQLTPVEEARQLARAHEAGASIPAIAAKMQKSSTWVQQRLRLLRYPDDVLTAVHVHGLALSVADLIAQFDNDAYRRNILDEVIRHGSTAAVVAVWLQHYQIEKPRLDTNAATVEEIVARRGDYIVSAPCEYCDEPTELAKTRLWRLCVHCGAGLTAAKQRPAATGA
jgi:ParB/RepB/Spo0J family partition protein